jgi:23S rRNA pseudouridine1911/1915/1917 synthase
MEYSITVPLKEHGKRIDLFLASYFAKSKTGYSRTFIKESILKGLVCGSSGAIKKPHYKVSRDEIIKVSAEPKKRAVLESEDLPIEVVYEDKDIAVINKPSGLVVHPAPGNQNHTLVNALLRRFKELSSINPQRPGIVHRLDKDTSGLLVIAKNNFAHLELAKQFAEHTIERLYIALVKGKVKFDEEVIELPISRHPYRRKNMAVSFSEGAKYAKTYYRTLKRSDEYSLLEIKPFTGRTHQLRVHLSYLGYPILGDPKYGKSNSFSRLALHAKSLSFFHPCSGKKLNFTSDTPKEFSAI